MGLLTNALRQQILANQSPPPVNALMKAAQPAQPTPFQSSSLPWDQQLLQAIDRQGSSGDAWNAIGDQGVLGYVGDELQKKYGTRNLSDFRYVDDPNVPGGKRLDWQGQQTPTSGLVNAMRNRSLQTGLVNSGGVGASGDGLGGGLGMGNAADNLTFGATWEGEGGTDFNFYYDPTKPNGVGWRTGSLKSNDTADALTALAVVGGGMLGGQMLGGMTGGGAVGSGAGFVGEGALSGIGAWDAALAGAPSWTAAGGVAGGAGALDLGGGISMGADGAITGATGLNPSTLSNAGLMESFGAGGGLPAVGGAGGAGGGGAAGVPPPANPYNPASYLNPTNLSNLASSGMSGFSWTDLIGPGLQLFGGAMNAKASGDAADAQLQAAREAAARFEPWRQAGAWGVGRAATMLGKDGPEAAKASFEADPGYQWRLEQGEKALTRNAAARGLMGSGKFLKDAMRFNQGEATQEFGNAYNRLANLAGLGQTATQSSSDFLTQGANAQAAGTVGRANAWGNALSQGYSMYANQKQRDENNALWNRYLFGQ